MTNLEHGKEVALLRCPFCGGYAVFAQSAIPREYATRIKCEFCGTEKFGRDGYSQHAAKAEAIDAWNRRPSPSRVTDGVKPLEWRKSKADWYSDSVVGQYAVGYIGAKVWAMLRLVEDGQDNDKHLSGHTTVDAAKAAAQEDYNTRIRSALTSAEGGSDRPMELDEEALKMVRSVTRERTKNSLLQQEHDALVLDVLKSYFRFTPLYLHPAPAEAVASGVTEEMVERAIDALFPVAGYPRTRVHDYINADPKAVMRAALTAALASSQPVPQRVKSETRVTLTEEMVERALAVTPKRSQRETMIAALAAALGGAT